MGISWRCLNILWNFRIGKNLRIYTVISIARRKSLLRRRFFKNINNTRKQSLTPLILGEFSLCFVYVMKIHSLREYKIPRAYFYYYRVYIKFCTKQGLKYLFWCERSEEVKNASRLSEKMRLGIFSNTFLAKLMNCLSLNYLTSLRLRLRTGHIIKTGLEIKFKKNYFFRIRESPCWKIEYRPIICANLQRDVNPGAVGGSGMRSECSDHCALEYLRLLFLLEGLSNCIRSRQLATKMTIMQQYDK